MKKNPTQTDIYLQNEYSTNRLLGLFLLAFVIMGTVNELFYILDEFNKTLRINSVFFFSVNAAILLVLATALFFRFSRPWIKYMLLCTVVIAASAAFCFYTVYVLYIIAVPIFLASRYFDRKITLAVAASTAVLFVISCVLNVRLQQSSEIFIQLHKNATFNPWYSYKDVLFYLAVPCMLLMGFICFFSADMTKRGGKLLTEKIRNTEEITKFGTEIGMAAQIQKSVLPKPEYESPDGHFALRACESPAKEVCGDFYDYFMLGDNYLGVVVADVSDKGLSAAMFMMSAKKALKCCISACRSMEEAVSMANRMICTDNEYGMFLTMWVGLIDIRSGVGKYFNAGHPFPVLRHADGSTEFIENEPDLFIGTFPSSNPASHSFRMMQGDSLFIYTDGLTDAENGQGESFGAGRMLECISRDGDLLSAAKTFAGDALQFDDITLLRLDCKAVREPVRISKKASATVAGTGELNSYLQAELCKAGCPDEVRRNAGVAVDEVCNNICEYAYEDGGDIELSGSVGSNFIEMTFSDSGCEFNPLSFDAPEREDPLQIGGFGISFVKQLADSVTYVYENGRNRLTLMFIW